MSTTKGKNKRLTMIAETIAAIKILKTTDKLIFYKIYLNTKASV